MKFIPVDETYTIADPETDFARAEKLDHWHLSEQAVYVPYGLNGQNYLPLKAITKAYYHDFQVRTGCCTGTWPKRGIVICYGEKGILKMRPNKEKNAMVLLEALQEKIPGLDTEIPDLYRKETRKGW